LAHICSSLSDVGRIYENFRFIRVHFNTIFLIFAKSPIRHCGSHCPLSDIWGDVSLCPSRDSRHCSTHARTFC